MEVRPSLCLPPSIPPSFPFSLSLLVEGEGDQNLSANPESDQSGRAMEAFNRPQEGQGQREGLLFFFNTLQPGAE